MTGMVISGQMDTALLAFCNNEAVGCGCFADFGNQTVEIKRMYVKPAFRKKGISEKILANLEEWAMEAGFKRAVLETGTMQPESLGLYKKFGYQAIPNFGAFKDKESCVCMGKVLVI